MRQRERDVAVRWAARRGGFPTEDAGVPPTALRGEEGWDVLGRASSTGTALGWQGGVELLSTGRKLAGVTRMVLRVRRQGESDAGQVAGGPQPAH